MACCLMTRHKSGSTLAQVMACCLMTRHTSGSTLAQVKAGCLMTRHKSRSTLAQVMACCLMASQVALPHQQLAFTESFLTMITPYAVHRHARIHARMHTHTHTWDQPLQGYVLISRGTIIRIGPSGYFNHMIYTIMRCTTLQYNAFQ